MPSWIKKAFNSYISKLDCEFSSELIEIKPEKKFSSIEQKRILIAEQIYRAHSILENHPYHRE